MPIQLDERISLLGDPNHQSLLTQIGRGIEKESLRITQAGKLSTSAHPPALGSALTHPHITTDFSEALLELITPVYTDIDECLAFLKDIHSFVYSNLENEELWVASMPCILEGDDTIPVAEYGSSNVATMKKVYRLGLGNRYGRLMQTIAGIHYNFSVPEQLWPLLQQQDYDTRPQQEYITDAYFKLIRNFRRFSWLLIYLYGASPAVCNSFVKGRDHQLQPLGDGTMHLPYGTALRMGDLGYQSNKQESLKVCYNSIDSYIETLHKALTDNQPDYEAIGLKDDNGYRQLSTSLLQIENEFYSPIRPKRVTQSGETPLGALRERGVEYIEVRCIDLNPFLPMGIDEDQIRFLDTFLLYCLFEKSRLCDDDDRKRINDNLKAVVNEGRKPDLILERLRGSVSLQEWGNELLDGMSKVAELLDSAHNCHDYSRVVDEQRQKILHSELTPSAQILEAMQKQKVPFFRFAMNKAHEHTAFFNDQPLSSEQFSYFTDQTHRSTDLQATIEQTDNISFDEYLANYYKQYDKLFS